MDIGGVGHLLDEIGGEGGGAHRVGTAGAHGDIAGRSRGAPQHGNPLLIGEFIGIVVGHRNDIEIVDPGGRTAYEPEMPLRQRIGIHHYHTVAPRAPERGQRAQIGGETAGVRLHQHRAGRAADRPEGEAPEQTAVFRTGEHHHIAVAAVGGLGQQTRHQRRRVRAAAQRGGHSHLLDDVAAQARRSGQSVVGAEYPQGEVHALLTQAVLSKESGPLRMKRPHFMVYRANLVSFRSIHL